MHIAIKRSTILSSFIFISLIISIAFIILHQPFTVAAQQPSSKLSLDVIPDPFAINVLPGSETNFELQLRNAGTATEKLKIVPKSYTVDENGTIKIDEKNKLAVSSWLQFSTPEFTLGPGQWSNQQLLFSLPKDSGYNYSFALVIRRVNENILAGDTNTPNDMVIVPTLVNVEKQGKSRKLDMQSFSVSSGAAASLPVKFDIKIKNMGNMTVMPQGTVKILRGSKDEKPLATLKINANKEYILPGNTRILNVDWTDGFPRYETTVAADGTKKTKEVWDWSQIGKLRIGQYTAKLVAVYNDGLRDVTIEKEVSFWVLPWKIILGFITIFVAVMLMVWLVVRKIRTSKSHQKI